MTRSDNWVRQRRDEAFAFGRELRNGLLSQYQERYDLPVPPPPAKIIDELLTDFPNARLCFMPLSTDRFAETRYVDGVLTVIINSATDEIPGVGDPQGVENVAKWHEGIHVVRDLNLLREAPQRSLPDFDVAREVVCRSGLARSTIPGEVAREFWAEEAGRAAAVSLPTLLNSKAFQDLLSRAGGSTRPTPGRWPLLYGVAEDIGVNISALVTQLSYEGRIVVVKETGRWEVYVQPALLKEQDGERK